MEMKRDFKNELLKRQEIIFEIESDKNPTFTDVKKMISEKLSKPEENIDVYSIKGNFGERLFTICAYIYSSKKDLEKIKKLQKTQKQRNEEKKSAEEEKKKAAEAPAENKE